MSYIVKNCPTYRTFYPDTGAEPFNACDAELPYKKCQNCTDCIIKQVIDKLREADNSCNGLNCTECSGFYMCHSQLANKILQLFDIEEINK